MSLSLETLELLPEELEAVKEKVRRLAYRHWEAAGSPPNEALRFWLQAEQEWIEHEYTPHRDDLAP
jgi:hypothetical protein